MTPSSRPCCQLRPDAPLECLPPKRPSALLAEVPERVRSEPNLPLFDEGLLDSLGTTMIARRALLAAAAIVVVIGLVLAVEMWSARAAALASGAVWRPDVVGQALGQRARPPRVRHAGIFPDLRQLGVEPADGQLSQRVSRRRPPGFAAPKERGTWTRWHITLSCWFRDHIYMRFLPATIKGKWFRGKYTAAYLANFLTFGAMDLWHGTARHYLGLRSLPRVPGHRARPLRLLEQTPP